MAQQPQERFQNDEETLPEMHRTSTSRSVVSITSSLSRGHEIAFIFVVCMAQLMTQAALGNTLAPLHIIGNSFGITNPGQLSWLIAAYSLTVGTFILIFGRCGDVFGYKRMFVIGFVWFGLWSLIAGLSVYSNRLMFDFARAFQGMGPAMLLPNSLALLGRVYPPGKKKNMLFALFGATAPNGAVLGMCFGSIFSQLAWWPWTFWTEAIFCFVFAAMGVIFIPRIPPHDPIAEVAPFTTKLRSLDPIGGALGVIALILINIAWNQAPIVGWSTTYVYFLLIIGLLIICSFFIYELRMSSNPLLPLDALSSSVGFVLACIACGWACFGIWVFYSYQFLETIRHQSALQTTSQFVTAGPAGLLASATTGILMHRVRPAWIMTFSLTAFTLGSVIMATAPVHQSYWAQSFVSMLLMPWGMDMSFPAATVILSDAVGRRHQGIAASLVNTVVNYSISIGLGLAGTVETNVNHGGKTESDTLDGIRGAQYMGVGLAALGVCVSILFVAMSYRRTPHGSGHGHDNEPGTAGDVKDIELTPDGGTPARASNASRVSRASTELDVTPVGPSLDLNFTNPSLEWEGKDRNTRARADYERDLNRHLTPSPVYDLRYVHPGSEVTLSRVPLAHLPA